METTNQMPNETRNETSSAVTNPSANPPASPAAAVPVTLQALDPLSLPPEGIVEQLRALRAQVPEYGQLETHSIALLKNANVDANFVQAANNVAGASSLIQLAMGSTPEVMNKEAEDARRWTVVEEEARAFLKGVANANLVRRHRVGTRALQGYNVAKELARIPEHADLLPHVTVMQKMNKFSRLRRKAAKKATPVTTTPATPESTATTTPESPARAAAV